MRRAPVPEDLHFGKTGVIQKLHLVVYGQRRIEMIELRFFRPLRRTQCFVFAEKRRFLFF